jgi:hypothetical protein
MSAMNPWEDGFVDATPQTKVTPAQQSVRDTDRRMILNAEYQKAVLAGNTSDAATVKREMARSKWVPDEPVTPSNTPSQPVASNQAPSQAMNPWEDGFVDATPPTQVKPAPKSITVSTDDALAAGTGAVKGATLGTSKYMTAGMAYLADRARNLMNNTPGMTWKQAIQYTKAEQDSLAEKAPVAYYGGELAGTVANSVVTGGTGTAAKVGLASPIGQGAIQGAVSGFTNNEDLKEAAFGAGVGGTLGGLAKAAPIAQAKIMQSSVGKAVSSRLKNLSEEINGALQSADDFFNRAKFYKQSGNSAKAEQMAAKAAEQSAKAQGLKTQRSALADQFDQLNFKNAWEVADNQSYGDLGKAAAGMNLGSAGKSFLDTTKNVVIGGATGGALGGLGAAASGNDIGSGALYGAAVGGGGLPALKGSFKDVAQQAAIRGSTAINPNTLSNVAGTAARLGTNAATSEGLVPRDEMQPPGTLKQANDALWKLLSGD